MFGDVTLVGIRDRILWIDESLQWEKYEKSLARAKERMRNALHIANSVGSFHD